MPPENATPIGSGCDVRASMRRSHLATSSASAPTYCRPISSRSAGSVRRSRREEARVGRIGIGAADERQVDDVVRRDHPGVARVELAREAVSASALMERVDAVRDVERRALVAFREEVAHRPVHRSRQPHGGSLGRRPAQTNRRWRGWRPDQPLQTRRRASSTSMFEIWLSAGSRRSTTRLMGRSMAELFST